MDGKPPLVDVIQGDKTCNGDFTFMGFKFKNNKYKSYPRQRTDWNKFVQGTDKSTYKSTKFYPCVAKGLST
jgi:hypothetical protein